MLNIHEGIIDLSVQPGFKYTKYFSNAELKLNSCCRIAIQIYRCSMRAQTQIILLQNKKLKKVQIR